MRDSASLWARLSGCFSAKYSICQIGIQRPLKGPFQERRRVQGLLGPTRPSCGAQAPLGRLLWNSGSSPLIDAEAPSIDNSIVNARAVKALLNPDCGLYIWTMVLGALEFAREAPNGLAERSR